jgi:hypothetical protein
MNKGVPLTAPVIAAAASRASLSFARLRRCRSRAKFVFLSLAIIVRCSASRLIASSLSSWASLWISSCFAARFAASAGDTLSTKNDDIRLDPALLDDGCGLVMSTFLFSKRKRVSFSVLMLGKGSSNSMQDPCSPRAQSWTKSREEPCGSARET